MAIAFVQEASGGGNNTTVITGTYASAQIVGDTNVIIVGLDIGEVTTLPATPSISDVSLNRYTLIQTSFQVTGSNTQVLWMWVCLSIAAASAGANIVTLTGFSLNPTSGWTILEYSGVTQIDTSVAAQDATSTAPSISITLAAANEMVVAACWSGFQDGISQGSTWNARGSMNFTAGQTQDKLITSSGALTVPFVASPTAVTLLVALALQHALANAQFFASD